MLNIKFKLPLHVTFYIKFLLNSNYLLLEDIQN